MTVSNVIRDHLLAHGFSPSTVQTLYDGIDAEAFRRRVVKSRRDIFAEFGIPERTLLIGLVGNIREWKGQELLIDSLAIVRDRVPGFICLLVGDVSKDCPDDAIFKKRLKNKIANYGFEDQILFTGFRRDVPDLMNAFDILVNPSIEPDPFPHVVLESMALGRAMIATDLGGARESIEDGVSGYLVPGAAPDVLADRLYQLMTDEKHRRNVERNALERVKLFNLDSHVEATESIYGELIGT